MQLMQSYSGREKVEAERTLPADRLKDKETVKGNNS